MTRKGSSRSSDRAIILSLLVLLMLEGLWLAYDLFGLRLQEQSGERAGYVISKANRFMKRTSHSLVWNPLQASDELNYYDTVMTLAQSEAKIYLNEKTEVTLSENTLISIEPPDDDGGKRIRLKLSRGDLHARNPFAQTRIEHPDWNITLTKGSDVDIKQLDGEKFQIQVKDGEATLNSDRKIGKDQVIEIEKAQVSKVQTLAKSFSWTREIPRRIYSRDEKVKIKLTWQGEAKALRWGREEIPVEGRNEWELDLSPGLHRIQALTEEGLSPWIEFEIWKAPVFHLLEPLPRSRMKTGEPRPFAWEGSSGSRGYRVEFLDGEGRIVTQKDAASSFDSLEFADEGDWEWQVKALDQDGFEIPSMDRYPLYLRHQPFEAPRVKKPELRKPAGRSSKDGASLERGVVPGCLPDDSVSVRSFSNWVVFARLFLEEAQAKEKGLDKKASKRSPQNETNAEELWEAHFEWEKVDGADQYVIEISETADFRSPLVNKVLRKNEFTWTSAKTKKYYWRVAAQSSQGRLGLFTDPEVVEFTKPAEPVATTKAATETSPSALVPVQAPAPAVESQNPSLSDGSSRSEPVAPFFKNGLLWTWRPSLTSANLRAEDFDVALSGGHMLGLAVENNGEWSWRLQYDQVKYSADPPEEFPTQPDLTLSTAAFELRRRGEESSLSWGALVKTDSWFERKGAQEIGLKNDLRAGLVLQVGENNIARLHFLGGSLAHELGVTIESRHSLGPMILGFGGEADLLLVGSKQSQVYKGFLILGFGSSSAP
jgi:hypothetical protein